MTAYWDPRASEKNSTTSALSANEAYTGVAELVDGYSSLTVSMITDALPGAGGLRLQFSIDKENWDHMVVIEDIEPGKARTLTSPPLARYFRIIYQNGPRAQSYFRLQTMYHPTRGREANSSDLNREGPIQVAIVSGDVGVKDNNSGEGPFHDILDELRSLSAFLRIKLGDC